jgi:tetratricopeptide (TPR) repeat protein
VGLSVSDVAPLLEALVSKSLVRQVASDSESRFRLLETIREYALERLAAGAEEQAIRWRHAGYYAWYAAAHDIWTHPRGMAVLEDELDNLRGALSWLVELDSRLPGHVICSDWVFWGEHANEGRRWLEGLLAEPVNTSYAASNAWYTAMALAQHDRDYPATRWAHERYWQMQLALGGPTHLQHFTLGLILIGEGDVAGAGTQFRCFLECAETLTDASHDFMVGAAHWALGGYELLSGHPAEAAAHIEANLAYARGAQQVTAVADNLRKLAFARHAQGETAHAIQLISESIALAQAHRYRRAIAAGLYALGVVILGKNAERAALLFGAAEALTETTSGMWPDEHAIVERSVNALRERLDPAALAERWAEGRTLDWETAVGLVAANRGFLH